MEKQIQIQFRLLDVKQLQFVSLTNQWPDGELQITKQLQCNAVAAQRAVVLRVYTRQLERNVSATGR